MEPAGAAHTAPRRSRHSVDRQRLVSLLDRVADTGILLVSAGAGYGKTSALSSWARGLDDVAVGWITCGDEHNDPRLLIDQLGSVLRETIPDERYGSLGDIADAIGKSDVGVVVVFDDAHHLSNPSVWSAVEDLLRRQPDNLRFVVCGRDEEGLPWHRLRAQGGVTEICGDDLRFTRSEATALLAETFGIHDGDEVVDELLAATEGWAAGLCLAGHALRHGASVVDGGALGRHRFIRGYFDDELLSGMPNDHVRFLEVTSLLERLDPELCDLLTDRSDSCALLEHFVDHNLFTEQISMRPSVFRYHQLFTECLRARASRMDAATITDKLAFASRWYEEHGLPDLAIGAAVRAGDVERVEALIREASGVALRAGLPHTVKRWLSALPQESLDAQPDLALLLARSAGATGDLLAARCGLAAVGSHLQTTTTSVPPSLRLAYETFVFVLALWNGDFDAAETDLERAEAITLEHRDDLGPDIFGFDPGDLPAYRALLHLLSGDLDVAIRQAERTLTPGQLVRPGKDAVLAVGVRALAMAWRGEPAAAREAVEQCRAAAATFRGRTGGLLSLLAAGAWCADSELAESDLARARTIVDEVPLPAYRAVYLLAEARMGLRAGRWPAAGASLVEAHDVIAAMPSSRFLAVIEDGLRADLAAAVGELADVRLNERELAVLGLIAAGVSRREAAARLYLSVNTVKTHLRSAYRKLSASNRDEAIDRARALGMLERPVSVAGR